MLNIDAKPTFWATVTVHSGGAEPETFRAKFNVLPVSRIEGLDFNTGAATSSFFWEALEDIDEVVDAQGAQVELTDDVMTRMIDNVMIRQALFAAYFAELPKAARGN